MLLRRDADRRIAIPQPSHAWVSGQLAAAWGNDTFARPTPTADVCLAAALHDIGWADWELAPTRDPETGWPRQFMQVSPTIHVDLWREAVRRVRLFGRYPALLVSLHADTIYTRHVDRGGLRPEDATAVRLFLDEQHEVQRALVASLRQDDAYRACADEDAIETNRLFIAAVDELSLKLCWGVTEPCGVDHVPTGRNAAAATLSLRPSADDGSVSIDPWPFGVESLSVSMDGQALAAPFGSDEALRQGLAAAPSVAMVVPLRPA